MSPEGVGEHSGRPWMSEGGTVLVAETGPLNPPQTMGSLALTEVGVETVPVVR